MEQNTFVICFRGMAHPATHKSRLDHKNGDICGHNQFHHPGAFKKRRIKDIDQLSFLDKNHWWVESIPWDHLMCSIFNNQHLGLSFSTSRECDAHVLPFAVSRPATLCLSGGHSPKASDSSAIFLPRQMMLRFPNIIKEVMEFRSCIKKPGVFFWLFLE